MSFKYRDSEEFRARIFLFAGYGSCTPFGLNLTNFAKSGDIESLLGFVFSIGLLGLGVFILIKSHGIIIKRDESNV